MELVRLAIDAYCAPRWLYTKAEVAEPVEPNCGIAPGCALATTMVKIYYRQQLIVLAENNPRVDLSA